MRTNEKDAAIAMALGRIFRMGARPTQPGDVEMFDKCRAIIMEAMGAGTVPDHSPNYARDRNKGAAGD